MSMSGSVSQQVTRAPRLAANYALLSAGELLAKALSLASFAHLARTLGPQVYGHLELAIAITFWLSLVADCGLSTYGAREIAKHKSDAMRLVAQITAIKGLLSLATFAALVILVSVVDRPSATERLVLLYGLTLLALPGVLSWVFQGLDEMRWVALASIVRWTLWAGGVFLLVQRPEQVWIAPLVELGALVSVSALYVRQLALRGGWGRLQFSPIRAWLMLRQAWFIGASEVMWAIKTYAATMLLGLLVGGASVGYFAAAHRVVVSLHTFVWLYFFNLLPSLSRCAANPDAVEGREALLRLTGASMKVTAWLAVFLGLVGTALAKPLMLLVFGTSYRESATVLQVLIWFVPLTLVHGHYRFTLIAYGKQRLEFVSNACGAGLNVCLNLLLVPALGPIGTAWALLASELFIMALVYGFTKRTVTEIPLRPSLVRPLVAGAVLAVVLYLVRAGTIWAIGGSAVAVYGVTIYLMQPNLATDVRSLLSRGVR